MSEPAPRVLHDADREPFTTLDGSVVRELAQVADGAAAQSLAEATVPPGGETTEHLHRTSEEIYRFVSAAAGSESAGRRPRSSPATRW